MSNSKNYNQLTLFYSRVSTIRNFWKKKNDFQNVSKISRSTAVVCFRPANRPCQTIADVADAITRIQRPIQWKFTVKMLKNIQIRCERGHIVTFMPFFWVLSHCFFQITKSNGSNPIIDEKFDWWFMALLLIDYTIASNIQAVVMWQTNIHGLIQGRSISLKYYILLSWRIYTSSLIELVI